MFNVNVSKDMCKYRTGHSKISRQDGEVAEDLFKNYMSRRQPVKTCREKCGYCPLRVTSTIQFLREDFGGVTSVRFHEQANMVAVGFNFGYLQVFEKTGHDPPVTVLRGWGGHPSVSCVRWHPREALRLYASSALGHLYHWDLSDLADPKLENMVTEKNNEINSFDFDEFGSKLVTGGKDACLRVYDTSTSRLLAEYSRGYYKDKSKASLDTAMSGFSQEDLHEKRIYCIKFQPDCRHVFLSGGWDAVVKVWDLRVPGVSVRNISGPYVFGETIDIHKGRVVTGSCEAKDSLQVWDLGSGHLLQDVRPPNRRVGLYGEYPYAVQYYRGDPSGDLVLAGGSGSGGLQMLSLRDNAVVCLVEDDKPVLAVDSADGIFAFGGKSHNLVLGKVSSSEDIVDLPQPVVSNATSYQTMSPNTSETNNG